MVMKSILNNFLESGHEFTEYESDKKYKYIFVNSVMVFTAFVVAFMSIIRFMSGNIIVGSMDVIFIVLTVLFLVRMRKDKDRIEFFSYIMLGIALSLFLVVFVFAPTEPMRISLFFMFITGVFFLKGKKIGIYALIFIIAFIATIHFGQIVQTNYSNLDIFSILLYLISLYVMLNAYESVKNIQYNKIAELVESLEMQVKKRTEELVIANSKLIEEKKVLKEISTTDQLTGLYNRFYIEETFKYEMRQVNRYKTELSIVMMDIDYFKIVNDTYGHNGGDALLRAISIELKRVFRDTDVVGRWGGEEFLILLPKTAIEDAYNITERLRKYIEEKEFNNIGKKTASFGITNLQENDTLDVAIGRADKALYDAKNSGRNQVKIAS